MCEFPLSAFSSIRYSRLTLRSSGFLISCFPLSSFTSSFWCMPFFPRRLFFFFFFFGDESRLKVFSFRILSFNFFEDFIYFIFTNCFIWVPFIQLESHLDWFSNFLIFWSFFFSFPTLFFFFFWLYFMIEFLNFIFSSVFYFQGLLLFSERPFFNSLLFLLCLK